MSGASLSFRSSPTSKTSLVSHLGTGDKLRKGVRPGDRKQEQRLTNDNVDMDVDGLCCDWCRWRGH